MSHANPLPDTKQTKARNPAHTPAPQKVALWGKKVERIESKFFPGSREVGTTRTLAGREAALGEGGCGFQKPQWASRALSMTSGCPLETLSFFQLDKLLVCGQKCSHLGIGCLGAGPRGAACRVLGVGEPLGAPVPQL